MPLSLMPAQEGHSAFSDSTAQSLSPVPSGEDWERDKDPLDGEPVVTIDTQYYTEIDESKLSQLAQNTPDVLFPTEIGQSMAQSVMQESTDEEVEQLHPTSVDVMMYPRSIASTVDDAEEASVPSRRLSELSSPRILASPRVTPSPRMLASPRIGYPHHNRVPSSPRIPHSPSVVESGQWDASFAMERDFIELSPFTVEDLIEPLFMGQPQNNSSNGDQPLRDDPSIMKFEELRVIEEPQILGHIIDKSLCRRQSDTPSDPEQERNMKTADAEISRSPFVQTEAQDGPLGITLDSILERYGEFDNQASSLLQTGDAEVSDIQRLKEVEHFKERTAWTIEKKVLLGQLKETKTELQELQTEHQMLQWVRDTLQYELYTLQDELSQAHSLQDELAQAHTHNSRMVRQGVLTIQHHQQSLHTTQRKFLQQEALILRISAHHDKTCLSLCFRTWVCEFRVARDRWRMALHGLRRSHQRQLSLWMTEWCAIAMAAKRERKLVIRVLLRWAAQQLSVVMRAWVLHFEAMKRRGAVETRAGNTRTFTLLAAHLASWHEFVSDKTRVAWKAVKLFKRVGARITRGALQMWHEEACGSGVGPDAGAQMAARIRRRRLGEWLLRWRCLWGDRRRLLSIGLRVRAAGLIPLSVDRRLRVGHLYTPSVARPLAAWRAKWGVGAEEEGLRTTVAGWRLVAQNSGRLGTAVGRLGQLREGTCLACGFYHWAGLVGDFGRVVRAGRAVFAMHAQLLLRAALHVWRRRCPVFLLRAPHPAAAAQQLSLSSFSSPRPRLADALPSPTTPDSARPAVPTSARSCSPSAREEQERHPRWTSPPPTEAPAAPVMGRRTEGPLEALVSWAADGAHGRAETERGLPLTGVMRRRLRALCVQWSSLSAQKRELAKVVSKLFVKLLHQVSSAGMIWF